MTWLLLGGLVSVSLSSPARGRGLLTPTQRFQILQSDSTTLVIKLDLPEYSLEPTNIDGRLYQSISIENFGKVSQPGFPELPQRSWLVAVPPEAQVSLEVIPQRIREVASGRILPAPEFTAQSDASSLPAGPNQPALVSRYVEDRAVYQANAFYPSMVAWLGEHGRLRDQSFIQVVISPIQYNPHMNLLRYTQSLKLKLTFEGSPSASEESPYLSARRRTESGIFEKILSEVLVNYESGKDWRVAPEISRGVRDRSWASVQTGPVYRITVNRDGIYQLTYADLQSAGLPVAALDPRTFRLFNQGNEVAVLVEGEADGRFDPEDVILFFGQKVNTKYTDNNVYWLTVGGAGGRRMMEITNVAGEALTPAFYKATLHLERNLLYQSRVPTVEGADHWYWNVWPSRDGTPLVYTGRLTNVAQEPVMATLRAKLQGFSTDSNVAPDHHLRLFLNGQLLQDVFWDGASEKLAEIDFPPSLLVEGENEIRIESPADTGAFFDQGLVNWFEIDYARRFVAVGDQLRFRFPGAGLQQFRLDGFTTDDLVIVDLTDALGPKWLTDFTVSAGSTYQAQFQDRLETEKEYLVASRETFLRPVHIEADSPSALRSPDNGADCILITHPDFYDEVLPLSWHRASQGLRTMIVDVQDIYDEFGDGIFSAEAIRAFLAYTYANWQPPAPSFVVLVGDGTFDFKNYLGTGERNFIPPLLRLTSPFLGEAASENRYVTISGDDILPDMFIGRLPVNTPDEARGVVNKILSYENNEGGEWTRRVMFVADNADNGGAFNLFSDVVADQHVPSELIPEKIYLGITHPIMRPVEAKASIIAGINEGRLLVNYVGHSFFTFWAQEQLLHASDLPRLTNAAQWPVVLGMSSYDGYFHFPGLAAMSETFLRAEGHGVIAWWGGTGLGLSVGHNIMNVGFFDAVFRDGLREIGPAALRGYLKLYQDTGGEDSGFGFLIDTFVVLGDPALRLAVPEL